VLTEIHISNFAIIEEQSISFGPGLNVISGETGAGKSIILQALELILGGRAKTQVVRAGAETCEVQALFDLSSFPQKMKAELPDIIAGDEVLLARAITNKGRSKVYINGRLGTLSLLEEVSHKLVNICGQSQHIRLLEPKYHLELIDGFAENQDLREIYSNNYSSWKTAKKQLTEVEQRMERNVLRKAELEQIVQELGELQLVPGIRDQLEADVKRSANAETLLKVGQAVLTGIVEEQGLEEKLGILSSSIQELIKLDDAVEEIAAVFESARTEFDEFSRNLAEYLSSIDLDREKLEALREQLAEIARLERKYRTNDTGLIELLREAQEELQLLDQGESIAVLKSNEQELFNLMKGAARRLTRSRVKAGRLFAQEVKAELAELNMSDAELKVNLDEDVFSETGQDRIEFFITTNKGEALRPLRQVASGGELSRIMLVLKKLLRDQTGVNVLVFDEVDSGVSGGVARAVGSKLKSLAEHSQVLCITHLPQVASLSDRHFLVEKQIGDRAVTVVRELEDQEKVDEIARMLAGYEITAASRESARELMSSKV
jgi:DNA repair protein RecN (Recombination protein N)